MDIQTLTPKLIYAAVTLIFLALVIAAWKRESISKWIQTRDARNDILRNTKNNLKYIYTESMELALKYGGDTIKLSHYKKIVKSKRAKRNIIVNSPIGNSYDRMLNILFSTNSRLVTIVDESKFINIKDIEIGQKEVYKQFRKLIKKTIR